VGYQLQLMGLSTFDNICSPFLTMIILIFEEGFFSQPISKETSVLVCMRNAVLLHDVAVNCCQGFDLSCVVNAGHILKL